MAGRKTIKVTQNDIDKAVANHSSRCVAAMAIARELPKANRIVVDVHSIRFTEGDRRFTYVTPHKVMDYIVAFDAGDTLHPFTFQLRDDQRFVVKRQKRTPAGNTKHLARETERNAKKQVQAIEAKPDVTPAERAKAAEKLAEAKRRRAEAETATPRGTATVKEDVSDVPAEGVRPNKEVKVFRSRRVYGQRTMRINNDTGPRDFRGPLDD